MEARVEMAVTPEDVQVAAKPQRRSFTAEYKRRILRPRAQRDRLQDQAAYLAFAAVLWWTA